MRERAPTVLFVHGSWHQPAHFDRVRKVFESAGYPTSCPQIPSFGAPPHVSIKDDAQCIRQELTRLVDEEEKDVIVVGHSYGGIIVTEAVDERFARKNRASKDQRGGVLHILFLCAFLLPNGVGLAGAFGGEIPPIIECNDQGMCMMKEPGKVFYNDLDEEEQKHWASLLKWCPTVTQTDPVTYTAYLYHPVTYLYCTNDAGIPYEVQQMMVKNISDSYGVKIATMTCSGSHSPYLSMPQQVLEAVQSLDT